MPDQPTNSWIVSWTLTFLGGGVAGTFLGHWLAIGREKRERRRDFLGFMSRFRSEAEAGRNRLSMRFAQTCAERIPEFRYKQASIRSDLSSRTRKDFDEAVESLCRLSQAGSYRVDAKRHARLLTKWCELWADRREDSSWNRHQHQS